MAAHDLLTGRLGIIGAGRVAQAMGLAMSHQAPAPPVLWARDAARGAAAAARIGAVVADDLPALMAQSDRVMIAVADDALTTMVAQMAPMTTGRHAIFHVSGRSGVAVLQPLKQQGAAVAAIHPAMTFTGDPATEATRMAGARFALTADDGAMAGARAVVAALNGVAVTVAEADRALYHAALCHGANHLVTLIAGACAALRAAGVDDPAALIGPLARAALDNGLARGMDGLSGPLLRGDVDSIARHLTAIGDTAPDLMPAYRAMALSTLNAIGQEDGAMRDLLNG